MNTFSAIKKHLTSKFTIAATALIFAHLGVSLPAQAFPGFSVTPKSGNSLSTPTEDVIAHVISELDQASTFELTITDTKSKKPMKVNVIFLAAQGAIEADPEIPVHLVSVRGSSEHDDSATLFQVSPMFVYSVKKAAPNRLRVEGNGGSAYGCSVERKFDLVLASKTENAMTTYRLKYVNVVDKKSGEHCKMYE